MVINDLDHDVEDLVAEDLPGESPETVQYIISQMELNKAGTQPENGRENGHLLTHDSCKIVLPPLFTIASASEQGPLRPSECDARHSRNFENLVCHITEPRILPQPSPLELDCANLLLVSPRLIG